MGKYCTRDSEGNDVILLLSNCCHALHSLGMTQKSDEDGGLRISYFTLPYRDTD